ncbi:hypothetical protein DAEQUDRAFT_116437 [Daedalea quercina L-15889]|uniref:Uncharacterized protein n=1 Tax=Daedalea quercina L-15889 TaxID=1314783 RepID=A0A165KSW3_9APHY|nr:hypothetical protein DAEQUDRAFT_116437 [Daedalea quercina L-15889]
MLTAYVADGGDAARNENAHCEHSHCLHHGASLLTTVRRDLVLMGIAVGQEKTQPGARLQYIMQCSHVQAIQRLQCDSNFPMADCLGLLRSRLCQRFLDSLTWEYDHQPLRPSIRLVKGASRGNRIPPGLTRSQLGQGKFGAKECILGYLTIHLRAVVWWRPTVTAVGLLLHQGSTRVLGESLEPLRTVASIPQMLSHRQRTIHLH